MSAAADAWIQAVTMLGGDRVAAMAGATDLERRYAEDHRRHHQTTHVNSVLRDALDLAAEVDLDADERRVLMLGVCAHDVVYDARPGADEDASADWARKNLRAAGIDDATAERVAELVLLTKDHAAPAEDVTATVLLDADIAILGSPADTYDNYSKAVRDEYGLVPDELWRVGRSHALQTLLSREPLFLTDPGRERWEATARANMTRELASFSESSES